MFRIQNPEAWDEGKARSLMEDGLGERRAEGYGQVLVNPDFLCREDSRVLEAKPAEEVSKPAAQLPQDGDGRRAFVLTLTADAAKRRFRQIARREAYAIVQKGGAPFTPYPNVLY